MTSSHGGIKSGRLSMPGMSIVYMPYGL